MSSLQTSLMRGTDRHTSHHTIGNMREVITTTPTHPQVAITRTGRDEPAGEWLIPQDVKPQTVFLCFYGGGCPSASHRGFLSHLAQASNILTLAVDYQYQANDVCTAYQWLLDIGYTPEDIIIGIYRNDESVVITRPTHHNWVADKLTTLFHRS